MSFDIKTWRWSMFAATEIKKTAEKKEVRVHIRWMIRQDMLEVMDIELQSFEFPWYEEDFIRS